MNAEQMMQKYPRAMEVFFKAMLIGYADEGGTKKLPVEGLPSHKLYKFEEDEYMLTDCYWTTKLSKYSGGTTLIYFRGEPIWYMEYWGWYDKSVIPFLKSVLRKMYEREDFLGGRGPSSHLLPPTNVDGRLVQYLNHTESHNAGFEQFHGHEAIVEPGGYVPRWSFGEHHFKGGWLLPHD